MQTFLGLPHADIDRLTAGSVAVLGVPDATPYEAGKTSHSQQGPQAIRAASQRYANWHEHYDFDTGGIFIDLSTSRVIDLGDVDCNPNTPQKNRDVIEATVRDVLAADALPLIFGGDDSVPIPVLSAYETDEPIVVLQIDAHLDWRDERFGERLGWSSPMRRASEMPWVAGIVQVGLRGIGSATMADVRDAKSWGAKIVTARDIHRHGVDSALAALPADARVFISLDLDALDPSVMPGVVAQAPGGLTYWHVIDLLDELAKHHEIVGCNIVELAPQRDPTGISAITAARIACNTMSAMLHSYRKAIT